MCSGCEGQTPYTSVLGGPCPFDIAIEYTDKRSGDLNLGIFNFVTTRNYMWCNGSGAFFSFKNAFGEEPSANCKFNLSGCGDSLIVVRSYNLGASLLRTTGIPVTTTTTTTSQNGTLTPGSNTTTATTTTDSAASGTSGNSTATQGGHAATENPTSGGPGNATAADGVYNSGQGGSLRASECLLAAASVYTAREVLYAIGMRRWGAWGHVHPV